MEEDHSQVNNNPSAGISDPEPSKPSNPSTRRRLPKRAPMKKVDTRLEAWRGRQNRKEKREKKKKKEGDIRLTPIQKKRIHIPLELQPHTSHFRQPC